MRKKFLCLFLVLTMTFGITAAFAYADDNGGGDAPTIQPYSTGLVVFGTRRISNTKASASVDVEFTGVADDYTVTITLQKKSNGSWIKASDIDANTIIYKGTNRDGILTYDEWTVKSGVVYRIKCVSTDKYDSGISYTSTTYSDPF